MTIVMIRQPYDRGLEDEYGKIGDTGQFSLLEGPVIADAQVALEPDNVQAAFHDLTTGWQYIIMDA